MKLKPEVFKLLLCTAVIISLFAGNCEVSADCMSGREVFIRESVRDMSLYSISAVLIDGESGRILFEKNGFEKRPMASTTKIMTLIIALENCKDDEVVTVSSYAAKMPDVQLNINEGEQYRIGDLYYSLMLESHNDTACAIAEHVGGSVSGFADLMNKKAEELGLSDTYFITPNGLDAEDEKGVHSTTAAELAQIMKYCITDSPAKEEFLRITGTASYSFTDVSGQRSFTVSNKNRFLSMMDGAISGKTGFTCDAGYCYVGALESEGRTFIVALLGCGWPNNKEYKWSDTKKLMQYGIENYNRETLIDASYKTGEVQVYDGIGTDAVSTYIDFESEILLGADEKVVIKESLPESIEAPVIRGEKLGRLEIEINGHLYAETDIFAAESIRRKDFMYYLKFSLDTFFLLNPEY